MDSFHSYLKKQLLEYVENEREKGVPLAKIEKVLLDSGHQKNIIDEVFLELKKEEDTGKEIKHKDPVENDLIAMVKNAFSDFMAQAKEKDIKEAKKDLEKTDTDKIVKEVIEEAEVREEKTMFEGIWFFIYLVGMALVVLFSAGATDSDLTSVVIGFLPAILNAFLSFVALSLADMVPIYVSIPLIISSVFYAIGKFTDFALFKSMDIEGLAIVNFLLALLFNVIIVYLRFLKPESMKRKIIRINRSNKKHKKSGETKKERKEIHELKKEFNL